MQDLPANSRVAFGLYEVDLRAGELWKAGYRVKLQSQPFKVLTVLLERPGQVVSREELQLRLWGKDTIVDFDHSLGIAINKIREALGDSAENPRFIETLSRRGYRFIAPVGHLAEVESGAVHEGATVVHDGSGPAPESDSMLQPVSHDKATAKLLRAIQPDTSATAITGVQPEADAQLDSLSSRQTRATHFGAWSAIGAAALLTAAGYFAGTSRSATAPPHMVKVTQNGHFTPSITSMESLAASATDGVHLFAPVIDNGHATLAAISLVGGAVAPLNIPPEIASPALANISPDGSRLLLREHLSPESEQSLWVVPTIGGSAQRVGNALAHDATWMPDGGAILYANGNDLYLTHLTGNNPQLYASVPGRAFWLRWEPNGRILRFTIIDPIAHTLSLWQISPGDRKPTPVLPGFTEPASECCGVWTADGGAFIFQSSHGGNTDLWKLAGESTKKPVRLTDGPLQFESPVAARSGNRVYFLGVDARSELQRFTPGVGLVPERGFLTSAVRIDYSRDGRWVSWTNSAGQLWRAKADGTEQLQLTPDGLDVFLAHWSPDGSRLALMAREPGKAWTIYLVGANGNDLQPVLKESRNAADPSWSSDGQSLVFGRINDVMGKESAARTLYIVDLHTNRVEPVPGSENLFSPRWSPNGRYIAALSLDQRNVRLFDVVNRLWTTLPVSSGADPVWSSDSRFLYLHASLESTQPIDRISISDGHVQEIVRLADSPANDAVDYVFGGLTEDNMPLVRARNFTGNVYSIDVK
jgi:Tol biopolymer transport system component/DNA-binding winged helix-turn-helix (wHTH) protein